MFRRVVTCEFDALVVKLVELDESFALFLRRGTFRLLMHDVFPQRGVAAVDLFAIEAHFSILGPGAEVRLRIQPVETADVAVERGLDGIAVRKPQVVPAVPAGIRRARAGCRQ